MTELTELNRNKKQILGYAQAYLSLLFELASLPPNDRDRLRGEQELNMLQTELNNRGLKIAPINLDLQERAMDEKYYVKFYKTFNNGSKVKDGRGNVLDVDHGGRVCKAKDLRFLMDFGEGFLHVERILDEKVS